MKSLALAVAIFFGIAVGSSQAYVAPAWPKSAAIRVIKQAGAKWAKGPTPNVWCNQFGQVVGYSDTHQPLYRRFDCLVWWGPLGNKALGITLIPTGADWANYQLLNAHKLCRGPAGWRLCGPAIPGVLQ